MHRARFAGFAQQIYRVPSNEFIILDLGAETFQHLHQPHFTDAVRQLYPRVQGMAGRFVDYLPRRFFLEEVLGQATGQPVSTGKTHRIPRGRPCAIVLQRTWAAPRMLSSASLRASFCFAVRGLNHVSSSKATASHALRGTRRQKYLRHISERGFSRLPAPSAHNFLWLAAAKQAAQNTEPARPTSDKRPRPRNEAHRAGALARVARRAQEAAGGNRGGCLRHLP